MAIPKTDRNAVDIVGVVAGDPSVRELRDGPLVTFSVTARGDTTDSVPVAWATPALPADLATGLRVRVRGRVQRRFWRAPEGLRSTTEVVATSVEW